jgi:hypothetical protein
MTDRLKRLALRFVEVRRPELWLRASAVLTLFALALMVWSLLKPTAMPIMVAMTLGQVFGTAAFAIYCYIVVRDVMRYLRRRWAARRSQRLPRLDSQGSAS